jgi:abortive infection bacteriophage resistance protein
MEILEKLKYYELLPETVTIQDLEHYVKSDSNHKLANRIFDIYVDEYESDYHTPIAEVLGIDEFNTIPKKLEQLMENNSNSLVHNFNLPQKFDAELEIP